METQITEPSTVNTTTEHLLGRYHEGISNTVYHANKEFYSSSQIKTAIDSAANFRWYLENGKKKDTKWKEGSAMDFGSLVHALLLEPHTVAFEFAFMDTIGRNWRTKADQQYKAQFLDEHKDLIVLAAPDMERARKCVEAVKEHEFAMELLYSEGKPELSGYYYDETDGLYKRFRPDKLSSKHGIVDVKTCDNIEDFFKKAKWEFHYDLSACMYLEGHEKLTGEVVDFWFVVVESAAPYRVAVYKASERFLENGRKKYKKACANIREALDMPVDKVQFQLGKWEFI